MRKKLFLFLFFFLLVGIYNVNALNFQENFTDISRNFNSSQLNVLKWDYTAPLYPVVNDLVKDRGSYSLHVGMYRDYSWFNCWNYSVMNFTRDGWMWFTSVGGNATSGCNNYQYALLQFDSMQNIDSSSKIYARGQRTQNTGSNSGLILLGKDSTDNQTCRFLLTQKPDDYTNNQVTWICSNNGNSTGDVLNNTLLWEHSPFHSFNVSDGKFENSTLLHYDFSLLPQKNISKIGQFDQLILLFWNVGTELGKQDLFRLDYLATTTVTNNLPTANISIQNFSYCLVNDTLDIPVNISAVDNEGDTIYYATANSVYTNITNQVIFTHQYCLLGLCTFTPDYSMLKPLNNGECDVNKKSAYNSSQHNFITREDYYGNEIYMLELNGDCNRDDKSFTYVLGPSTGLFLGSEFWDLADTEGVNISYHRSDNYELLKLQLVRNVSNLDVYFNQSIIITQPVNSSRLSLNIQPNADNYQIRLSNGIWITNYYLTRDPFIDNVQYVKYTPKGKITLQRFFYQATVQVPQFTTTTPTHLTVSKGIGRDYYTIFITDNINLNSDFATYTVPFTVYTGETCRYMMGETLGNVDTHIENQDILGAVKSFLGVNLKNYLNTLGSYEKGKNLLWTIFFFLLLGLIAFFSLATGSVVLEIPLMLSSLSVGFLAFLIDYTGIFVSMLIILALSLVASLGGIFGGGR